VQRLSERSHLFHLFAVFAGIALAVLPAAWQLGLLLPLFALLAPGLKADTVVPYGAAWVGLLSLGILFYSFVRNGRSVSPAVWVGLSVGVAAATWSTWLRVTSLSRTCSTCIPLLELLAYNPITLCLVVAVHWAFLYIKGFKLGLPGQSEDRNPNV
jgi:hypothetical protein